MFSQKKNAAECGADRERAVVAVQVGVMLTVLIGVAALSIDVGVMYNAKGDLQRTADAAALAAAESLGNWGGGNPIDDARAAALEFTQRNKVFGQEVTMDPGNDVTFGRATFNGASGDYDFTPDEVMPDAVRVRVRKTVDSANGALTLYFARIFGIEHTDIEAEAIAVMVPRDIAIVADLSGSHNDDSEFRHYQLTDINIYDVWDKLPGGVDDVGGMWNPAELPPEWWEGDGSAPQAAGPAWGFMQELGFGTTDIDGGYDPASDPGLLKLAYNQNWSNAQLENYLTAQGYAASEVDALMSGGYDSSGAYAYRVAAALGLAVWNSGQPGGLWEQLGIDPADAGNGNAWVGANELNWTEAIFSKSVNNSKNIWMDYINNYMNKNSTTLYQANGAFKYQFGVKTFVNYLLEKQYQHSDTPELAAVPAQPMQAVKDAVHFMVELIDDLDTDDQLSLEIYGTTARHEVDLTHDHAQVSQRLDDMQAGHYDPWTNTGGGLERAIEELSGSRARELSRKVVILLTDGIANVTESGQVGNESGGAQYALSQAGAAAGLGMRIFAVSVGAGANQSLMQEIAQVAEGEHFHAQGSIEQYSAQLVDIFGRLASKRSVELIK